MSAIKRFFQKKKLDIKFKKAGAGHKLTETYQSSPSKKSSDAPAQRTELSESAQRAAEAAVARMSIDRCGPRPGTSMRTQKEQMRQEMEADAAKQHIERPSPGPRKIHKDCADVLGVHGVYFKCPMIGPEVLPKAEMEGRIHEYLLSQLSEDPEMASSLMIYTLNKDKEKVKACVDILCKYLDNLVKNDGEEKFRKIRIENKVYKQRVEPVTGVDEFLQSVGFMRKLLPNPDQIEETYYVIDEERAKDSERLTSVKEILLAAEPIKPELDHSMRLFRTSGNLNVDRMSLPNEFYTISKEELKKEMQIRNEAVEKLGMLRTKAMRERDELRELRKYRYTLVRVRFPNSLILQGTFRSQDKFSYLKEFVRDTLEQDWIPFNLTVAGQKVSEDDATLAELGLAPAAVLNFAYDPTVMAEVTAQKGVSNQGTFVKPELMVYVEDI